MDYIEVHRSVCIKHLVANIKLLKKDLVAQIEIVYGYKGIVKCNQKENGKKCNKFATHYLTVYSKELLKTDSGSFLHHS